MITITNIGSALILQALTAQIARFGLFTNDIEPTPEMVNAISYAEPTVEGYSRLNAQPGSWRFSDRQALHADLDFTFKSAPGTLYGFFATDQGNGVVFAGRFRNPYDFSQFGGLVTIVPAIYLK